VIYIGATADRITPRPEDFIPSRARAPASSIISAANEIFETNKFDGLRVVNLTTGSGNRVYVMKVGDNPVTYHSEKQFSLGELCILKLITTLTTCPNSSLVLIDELEMALHPRAQIKLYKYLTQVSDKKNLTVIFSTHSVSLLKSVPHQNIIFLDRGDDGVVHPIVGCFPAYAIGNITIGEERTPDVILYVEDDVARSLVDPLAKLAMSDKYGAAEFSPSVKVVPIGGFKQVISFLAHHKAILPARTKSYALLDKDVEDETVANWKSSNNYARLKELEDVKGKVDYLAWTPEVGIVSFLRDHRADAERDLRDYFGDPSLVIDSSWFSGLEALLPAQMRQRCKAIHGNVVNLIADATARSYDDSLRSLSEIFAKRYFTTSKSAAMNLLAGKLS
jgi:hypothetical protein